MLTDLLTRPDGTAETSHNARDSHHSRALVNETRTDLGDQEDVRRGAHNPAIYRARFVPERADIRGLQRSLADSASDGLAGPEQVDPCPRRPSKQRLTTRLALAVTHSGMSRVYR